MPTLKLIQKTKIFGFLLFMTLFLVGCGEDSEIVEAKQRISRDLKDPASVQYRNIHKYSQSIVCGEYNAKNSYGAYVGFKQFISGSSNVNIVRIMDADYKETSALCNDASGKFFLYDKKILLKELKVLSYLCDASKDASRCDQINMRTAEFKEKYPTSITPKLGDEVAE